MSTVRKPVYETAMQQQVSVVRKPVTETVMQQQVSVVRKPVYETAEREEAYTVAEPVTTYKTAYADRGGYVDQVTPMVAPGSTQLGWVQGGWAVNPYTGLASWQPGGYAWTITPSVAVNQVNRVYQPNVVAMQVPETSVVNRVVTRKVPVQTMRYVDEQVVQQVPVQTMKYVDEQVVQQVPVQTVRYVDEQVVQQVPVQVTKMVAEEQVRQVPVQTVRKVVERVENKVPVQVCRYVSEEQVRKVPVQVYKVVTEEKVEPVTVQVCKYVTEERTAQVPRVVEKRTPYAYTVRSPRTVVLRVPLDPCGNPIPTSPSATGTVAAPRAATAAGGVVPATAIAPLPSAKPTAPSATPAPTAAPSLSPAEAAPLKTFRDAPAETGKKPVVEGWGPSPMKHLDPATGSPESSGLSGSTTVAERPVAGGEPKAPPLEKIEVIPVPNAKAPAATVPAENGKALSAESPTLEFAPTKEPAAAPSGPSVSPAPPATDSRDLPAAGTSTRPSRYVAPFGDRST